MDEVKLLPCRDCGAECRIETFGGEIHSPIDLWLCSNHKMFGGNCLADIAYFDAASWNTRNG